MNIALDFDGVITNHPHFFSMLSNTVTASGGKVYVVSDSHETYRGMIERELKNYDIKYVELIITAFKEKWCVENGIDYAFDDDADGTHNYYPNSLVSWHKMFRL